LDKTYRAIAREVKIPGFRPGKAPKPIIDAQVGADVVLEEFVSASVPAYFRTAVTDEDLAPIGEPEVDVEQLEPGKPFIFTATVGERLDAELVGTKPGDIVSVDDELPAQRFGEELAGPTSFRVLVKDVKSLKLPDADDAFAKTASEFDTVDELRADLREKIHE